VGTKATTPTNVRKVTWLSSLIKQEEFVTKIETKKRVSFHFKFIIITQIQKSEQFYCFLLTIAYYCVELLKSIINKTSSSNRKFK